jgi:hypothetical protein
LEIPERLLMLRFSAIDQLPEVVARFTGAVEEETGWMGVFMAGGPMPNRDGAISIKT